MEKTSKFLNGQQFTYALVIFLYLLTHGEDGNSFDGGHCPRSQMKVLRVGFNRLVTPLESRCEEPRKSQNYPPDGAGHAKI